MHNRNTRARMRRSRHLALLLATCTAAVLARPQAAQAQFVVSDPGHMAATVANGVSDAASWVKAIAHQAKEAVAWGEQKYHRLQQFEHMRQQLLQIAANPMLAAISLDDGFKMRPLSHGLYETCGSSQFDPVELLVDRVTNLKGSIKRQQMELCARIVMVGNKQYNATVELMEQLNEHSRELGKIERERVRGSRTQGHMTAIDSDLSAFSSSLQFDLDAWNTRMQAYDKYLLVLAREQNRLSYVALRGQPSIFGEVIKATTLRSALDGLK